jgi:branched-subunit amino acid transport protein
MLIRIIIRYYMFALLFQLSLPYIIVRGLDYYGIIIWSAIAYWYNIIYNPLFKYEKKNGG